MNTRPRPASRATVPAGAWGGLDGSWNNYLDQAGWRHWAVTCDVDAGTAELYFDYQLATTFTSGLKNGGLNFPHFRIGARPYNASSPTVASNFARGQMTCLRVSDEILTPEKFLCMGSSVFYPFKDAAAGATVTTITNAAVPGTYPGVAGTLNRLPKFDADRPGKYIFASSARDRVLAEDPQSIHFGAGSWDQDAAWIAVTNLAGRMFTGFAERFASGYTMECFFKKQHHGWGNLNIFSFNPGLKCRILCNDSNINYQQQDQSTSSSTCNNYGESFLDDGQWHHLAVVFTKDTINFKNHKDLTIYVDYAKAYDQKRGSCFYDPGNYRNTLTDKPFFFGNEQGASDSHTGFMGRLAAFRILPRALSPSEFMVAADTLETPPADAGFRWRFEEETATANLAGAIDSLTAETWANGFVTKFGAGPTQPVLTRDVASIRVKAGDTLLMNRVSVAFSPSSGTNRVVLQNRPWCGMPGLHPASWTLEAFVKPSAGVMRAQDVLVAGRGRLNPSTGAEWYDFALVLQPDGRLGFKGYRDDGVGGKTSFAFMDVGPALADGVWHALAVTYDASVCKLAVWADGAKVGDMVLDSGLVDSLDGRYQVAHGCSQGGFDGLIDEVRFTGRVVADGELQKPYVVGTWIKLR